ncbi:phosphomannomutase, partial [Candidatus Dependentiae bacterium]|nr:phosphomannomutase [Candidatus Dependentiae bacterium]
MTLKFGTSGVRGLVTEMTDLECYLFSRAFAIYVKYKFEVKEVSIAGDYRTSTPRIIKAVISGIKDENLKIDYCGYIPTPALVYISMLKKNAGIMVTGSHIPDDRNGIKFNLPDGEILKCDEKNILEEYNKLKFQNDPYIIKKFDSSGNLLNKDNITEKINKEAEIQYMKRYSDNFEQGCLSGYKIVVYQH